MREWLALRASSLGESLMALKESPHLFYTENWFNMT
jgi:hypothetical protein